MPCTRNRTGILLLATLMLLASCGGLKISPPGPSSQTLFIIPVELDANVVAVRHGFYYKYEITKVDDASFSFEVDIKFPVPGDIIIVDSLPPGEYYVRELTILPIGTGTKTYGTNSAARFDLFSLKSGKITIFSKSLKVILRNKTPGRIETIIHDLDIVLVTSAQEEAILATLKKLPNFEAWSY